MANAKTVVSCALYLRISQDRAGNELGIERQRQDCTKLAKKNGWKIAREYVDDDRSAYSGKPRPGYLELLAALERGEFTAIVAWHPDRLHRRPTELEHFIDCVNAAGATVATVQAGEYDLSTASGRMVARIVGAVARHESEQKSERQSRQREQAALQGRPHGGIRSFGYDLDPDEPGALIVVADEAAAIQDAADRLLGGESLKSIARDWNAQGLRGVRGTEWTIQTLRQTLLAPKLAALRVHRGEIVGAGNWEPILTRAEHEELSAFFAARLRTQRGRPPTSLLGGIVECQLCGARMHQSSTGRYRRYACHAAPGRDACGRLSITADPTDEIVTEAVLTRLDTPLLDDVVVTRATRAGSDDVEELEARLAELAEVYAAGSITAAEWIRARAGIEHRLARARESMAASADIDALAAFRKPGVLRKRWPELATDERRAVIAAVVERVVISPASSSPRYDPARVSIEWAA